ncbi:MAG: SDR family oxidoreductase [Candidatus Methanoperedens sp.]|nr:SDR family oxidoreductase [Candidatus Methanoperedens sp.]
MKCLVTGGAGFIGSHIVNVLLDRGHSVVCLDNFSSRFAVANEKENIKPFLENNEFELVEGDIRNKELLHRLAIDTDFIFHEAALVSVVESMRDPVKTIDVNTIGTLNILKAALTGNVKKVIIASSAAVYGDSPEQPKKEDMTPYPKSPYAISKLDCEYAAKIFYEEYGLKTTSLRYFNVYGQGQDPSSPYAAVIPIFIRKALKNEDIPIYGDGSQTRDFIFVKDVVHANELVMSKGDGRVFNVANGTFISISELAELIIEQTDSKSKIVYEKPRAGDIKNSFADTTEIKKMGFKPRFSLKSGIGNTIEWLKKAMSPTNPPC